MHKSLTVGCVMLIIGGLAGYACSQNGGRPLGSGFPPSQRAAQQTGNRFAGQAQPAPAPAAKQTRMWAVLDGEANDAINKKLNQPLSDAGLDFVDTPLEEVAEFLRDEYEIAVQLDIAALDEIGLGPDEAVNASYRGIKLAAALKLMLKQLELAATPVDGYLLITTEEECETRLLVVMYPVGDLDASLRQTHAPRVVNLGSGGFGGFGGGVASRRVSPLEDVIVECVATKSWAANGGGEAKLNLLPNGVLVVSQTAAVHDQVLAFLNALRKAPPPLHQAAIFSGPAPIRNLFPAQQSLGSGGLQAPFSQRPQPTPTTQFNPAPQSFFQPGTEARQPERGASRAVTGPDGEAFDFGNGFSQPFLQPTPARPANP